MDKAFNEFVYSYIYIRQNMESHFELYEWYLPKGIVESASLAMNIQAKALLN